MSNDFGESDANVLGGDAARDSGDYASALMLYGKAAAKGLAAGEFKLGLMYQRGNGVAVDKPKAMNWYRKAAAQGVPAAQVLLGRMYYHGEGVPVDYAQAREWIRRGAEQGAAGGAFALGVIYADRNAGPPDYAESLKWFDRAAQQGFPHAEEMAESTRRMVLLLDQARQAGVELGAAQRAPTPTAPRSADVQSQIAPTASNGLLENLFGSAQAADQAGGTSGLHTAAQNGDAGRVRALIGQGVNVNQTSAEDGATPLHYAAERGHLEAARVLLEHGALVDSRAGPHPTAHGPVGQGNTPLIFAAAEGHPEVVELLLDHGAGIDMANTEGRSTALFLAAQRGRTAAVDVLLRRGADARLSSGRGVLPLHIAAECGHLDVARLLLANGSPVDQPTPRDRDSPLHDAAQNGHDAIVALLLERGADPNHVDRMGNTPLHVASHSGHLAVVRRLVANGADPAIRNAAGQSAADIACERGGVDQSLKPAITAALRPGQAQKAAAPAQAPTPTVSLHDQVQPQTARPAATPSVARHGAPARAVPAKPARRLIHERIVTAIIFLIGVVVTLGMLVEAISSAEHRIGSIVGALVFALVTFVAFLMI